MIQNGLTTIALLIFTEFVFTKFCLHFIYFTYYLGLKGSPDLAAAEKVAKFIGTKHYSYTFTVQQGLDALRDVIYHLETYDVTTVRASTPMFLLARRIKATGCKMVLSGEGADEIFAGYLYFHKAPDSEELHRETVNKVIYIFFF